MRIFGREITLRKKAFPQTLSGVTGSWFPIVDFYPGAWQQNVSFSDESLLSFYAVFSCVTVISKDIAKLKPKLVQLSGDAIWVEASDPKISVLLKKPNRYQNHIQFKEWWLLSKLVRGNTYALKRRDADGDVDALYLLDPGRVTPLVAPDGEVFYQLNSDNLTGLERDVVVPASEIIHDRWNCLFHPLVGLPPLYASAMAANIGLNIQNSSKDFFGNRGMPSGILTAPGNIPQDKAEVLKTRWQENYGGKNRGKVAVLGDGLEFKPVTMTAVDAQLIEQLKWSAEVVCSTYHVPRHKAGVGPDPTYNNVEALETNYYSQCLQFHIESMEECLNDGLGLNERTSRPLGIELNVKGLLRMDSATQVKSLAEGIKGSLYTVNGARREINQPPVEGGDTVYMQQQNYSLAALSKRDNSEDPFKSAGSPSLPPPADDEEEESEPVDAKALADALQKELSQYAAI